MAIFNSGNFMSVSDPLNFSQEERVVGFWIDGRPIYQRTVVATNQRTSTSRETFPWPNVEEVDDVLYAETSFKVGDNIHVNEAIISKMNGVITNTWNNSTATGTLRVTLRYIKKEDLSE